MADKTTKVLEVIVDNNKAVASIAEYNQLIDDQKAKQKALAEEYKAGNRSQVDYQRALAKSKEEVKAYSRSVQELSKEIQNNIKDGQEQEGSLRGLRAQLSNLTKEYDALSRAERQGGAGQALVQQINSITNELKEAEEETQRFYRNVGNYPDVKPLEEQLGAIKKEMAQLKFEGKDNTEEFAALAEEAGRMKDALADTEAQINGLSSDTQGLDAAMQGLTTVMSGLSVMSMVFADGSEEGEKFASIIQKIQMVMMALTAIQTIYKNLQKESMLYQAAERVQMTANNALKKIQTALTVKQTAATGAQTVAQRILNAVMKANPVFLLISAFAALAAGVAAAAKAMSKSSDEMKELEDAISDAEKALDEHTKTYETYLAVLEKVGASQEKILYERIKTSTQLARDATEYAKLVIAAEDRLFGDLDRMSEAVDKQGAAAERMSEALSDATVLVKSWSAEWDKATERAGMTDTEILLDDINRKYREQLDLIYLLNRRGLLTIEEGAAAIEKVRADAAQAEADALKKEADAQAKAAQDAQKKRLDAAKKETELLRKVTDERLDLIKDENERAAAEEQERHRRAVEDLQNRLATETDLTPKQRAAINQLIELEEKKHLQTMAALDNAALEDELQRQADLIKLRLEAAEEGGQEEFELKLQQLQAERDLELSNLELTEEQKALIREKYAQEEESLREERSRQVQEKELEELRLLWQNKIDEAALQNQNTLALEVEARKAELDALHQMEGESNEEFRARELAAKKAYNDAQKALNDYEVEITQTKVEAIEGIIGGLTNIMNAFGEENKALAKASKVLALAEIAINTGKAIAAGVAQSQSVPFPANIAAVATTITTVLANIASAISTVKSAKFATGGLVRGAGTGTSDSIPAMLSNGESVMNARSTAMFSPLLSAMNQAGGGVSFNPAAGSREGFDFLAAAVESGMKHANISVAVDEISRVNSRVTTIKERSRI